MTLASDNKTDPENTGSTLTLLLSRRNLPKNGEQTLFHPIPKPSQVHLFLMDQATHRLHEDFSQLPPGKRIFCAHRHRQLQALPAPKESPFEAGGLANLGEMIRQSHWIASLPNSHWPRQKGKCGVKSIGLLLGNEPSRQKESIRLATGLAGCNHSVTLYSAKTEAKLRLFFPETAPLLDALNSMGAVFKKVPQHFAQENHAVLLQI